MEGARKISPIQIRFPTELKEWLKSQAVQNRRSVNSEVVALLEQARANKPEANQAL